MSIIINGKTYKLIELDTIESIIEKIAYENKLLPNYISIQPKILKQNINYTYKLLNDILKNLSYNDFISQFDSIKEEFMNINELYIILLWKYLNPSISFEKLIDIIKIKIEGDNINLHSSKYIEDLYTNYIDSYEKAIKNFKTHYQDFLELNKEINNIKEYKLGEFITRETTLLFDISLPNKESIIDIFDNIKVSSIIPFVVIRFNKNLYYKIYDKFTFPKEWLIDITENNIIYMKIHKYQFMEKETIEENYDDYINIEWNEKNNIIAREIKLKQKEYYNKHKEEIKLK